MIVACLVLAAVIAGLTTVVVYISGMGLLPGLLVVWVAFIAAFLLLGLAAGGSEIASRAGRSR